MRRLFPNELLSKLIFILALVLLFSTGSLQAATSPDAIAFRVMPNSDHLSPLRWYQENIKVKGSPQALVVDGYEAVRDGRTVYINAANINLANPGGEKFYTNIYIISYNQQAESATIDIFGQILSHWKFNANISDSGTCSKTSGRTCLYSNECPSGEDCLSPKAKVIRDTKRLADLADMESALANYQAGPSGDYPTLAAGSYIAGKSISVWPSWRATLSKDLAMTLPLDPVNKLGDCSSPPGYNPTTCWNQTLKKFADSIADSKLDLPTDSRAYVYSYNGNKSYSLCAIMESGYLTTLLQGACAGSAVVGHGATCTDTVWNPRYTAADICAGESITETSNCGRTKVVVGIKPHPYDNCAASTCVGKTCDTGCRTLNGTKTGGDCDCAATSGDSCDSSTANNCGEYGHGTYNCAGFCSATTPPADVTITCNDTNNPNQPNCQPGAPVNSEINASGGICCSDQTCYKCATGYTWDGTSCQLNSPAAPLVTAFDVQPRTALTTVTATYTVTDNSALQRVELWRAAYNSANCNEAVKTGCAWSQIQTRNIAGVSQSGNFTDTPAAGSYWYGLHVFDTAGNQGTETSPIKVTITAACADADGDTYDNCNPGETGDDGKPKDCDDTNNFIKPGATETCDTLDNNCNGNTDEGCDDDRDGFCNNSRQIYNNTSMCANTTFTGDGMYGDDCDDTDASKHPGGASCQTALIVSILYPTTFEFLANNYVTFSASAMGGSYPYKYAWQSSLDGNLYTGYNNYLHTNTLSVGTHTITLTVTDNLNLTSTKTFNLTIKAVGSFFADLNSPQNGNQFTVNSPVWFNAFVSGATSPITYRWISDRTGGEIGNSSSFSISTLPLGDNKITVTITDAAGAVITKSVNIKIVSGLLLNLYLPTSDAYEQGATVSFNAHVSGGTSPYTYIWSSDKDGTITSSGDGGEGGSFTKNDLSINTHLITVIATDSLGATASQSVTIEIVPARCLDDDQDGYGKIVSPACANKQADCDDTNPSIKPGATEICGNAVDENCSGSLTDCPVTFTVLSPASDGLTFTWGSKLNVKIQGTPITNAYVVVYSSTDTYLKSMLLYNDGAHNDGAANDDIWGVDTSLIFPDGNYYLNATINTVNYTKIRNFNVNNAPVCTTVVNNGSSADKLDIVFVADQYTNAEMPNFQAKVQSAYTYLFGIKPFDAQKSKINIHRVDSQVNLGCSGWGTNQPNCNSTNIVPIANLCPGDRTIVLVDGNFRSYAYFGGYAIVAANNSRFNFVVVHEFGHNFGLLYDEYVDNGLPDRGAAAVNSSVNCDTNSTCAKWSTKIPTPNCYQGCAYRNTYYRSVNAGIMRTGSTDYGTLNIDSLNTRLNTNYK